MNLALPGDRPKVLREELKRHAPLIRKALFFSVLVNALILAPTFFMLEVYDRVVNSRNHTTLVMLLLLVIGVYVLMELLELVRGAIMQRVGEELDASLRKRLFDTVFESKLRRQPGTSTQPFTDLRTVRDFLVSQPLMAMMDAPASLLFMLVVFIISPWLGVCALLGAIIQIAIAYRTEKRTMPLLTEANKSALEAQAYASGTLRNAQVIEAMGMMGSLHARWRTMQVKFLRRQAEASDQGGVNSAGSKFIQMMQGSVILGASCWLSLKGGMLGGGGMMIVASTLGSRILAPLGQLVMQWQIVVNARNAASRLETLLGGSSVPQPGMPLPAPKGKLTVENVLAAAPGTQVPILRGVNFGLDPGDVLVVIGPSAAGKTTLARVLMGIWPANSGKVRLDGSDVFAWNKDELGPHVGYLPQNVELFDGTIAENIARFGEIEMDKVRSAAELVGLAALVDSLPDGYDSRVGDEGAFLSGGQRQRVGLARAVYGAPRFVVLDEPNASLDEAGEKALLSTITQLKAAGSTVVLITHRVNVLPVADKLLVLRDGQVALFGPKEEVMAAMRQNAQPGPAPGLRPAQVALAGGAA